jgi:hypothetical protein
MMYFDAGRIRTTARLYALVMPIGLSTPPNENSEEQDYLIMDELDLLCISNALV